MHARVDAPVRKGDDQLGCEVVESWQNAEEADTVYHQGLH